MNKATAFWIVFLIAVILYGVLVRPVTWRWGGAALIFVLLAIVGWAQFGPPIH